MREHFTSRNGWIGLAVGVGAFDILAPKGQTLSEGMDRALEHPTFRYAAIGAVALTAAHLLNAIPGQYDPFARALAWKDRDD